MNIKFSQLHMIIYTALLLLSGCANHTPPSASSAELQKEASAILPVDFLSESIEKVNPHAFFKASNTKNITSTEFGRQISGYYMEVTERGEGPFSVVPIFMENYCIASGREYTRIPLDNHKTTVFYCTKNNSVFFRFSYSPDNIKKSDTGDWYLININYSLVEAKGTSEALDNLFSSDISAKKKQEEYAQQQAKNQLEQQREQKAQAEITRQREVERKQTLVDAFRNSVKVGTESHCGLILSINGPVAVVQAPANIGQYGMKISQLYPPGLAPCKFFNGTYEAPILPY